MLMDPAIFGVRSRLPFPLCNPQDTPSHQPVPCGSRTERVEWRLGGCFLGCQSRKRHPPRPGCVSGEVAGRAAPSDGFGGRVQSVLRVAPVTGALTPGRKCARKSEGLEGQG